MLVASSRGSAVKVLDFHPLNLGLVPALTHNEPVMATGRTSGRDFLLCRRKFPVYTCACL